MKTIKAVLLLFRLIGRLEKNRSTTAGSSLSIIVESGARLEERRRIAVANGEPLPDPRVAAEVNVWDDVSVPAKAHRGATIAEALEKALHG